MTETTLRRRWFLRHRFAALVAVNVGLMGLAAVGLELAFRLQLVDFWGAELRGSNPELVAGDSRPTVLVLGDSFTAGRGCLAERLGHALGDSVQVVNSGVSGTTARDAALMVRRRLARFHPEVVIHQLYVGNDLLETRHVLDHRRIATGRSVYWSLLDRGWWSLGWLNFKLGQLKGRVVAEPEGPDATRERQRRDAAASFDPTRFRSRDRRLISTDPRLIIGQIGVRAAWAGVWPIYRRSLCGVADATTAAGARLVVVVVPHCVQVSPEYRDRFRRLGADIDDAVDVEHSPSRFVELVREALPDATVVDPLPAMQSAERAGVRLYRTHDPHLRVVGQDLLAGVVIRDGRVSAGLTAGVRPSP